MPDRRAVEEVEEQGEEEEVEENTEKGSVRVKTKEIEIKRFRMNSKTKKSNETDDIEETTETSNSQQESSDEVEIVDEASDYGSTFQSFRSEDDYDPYDLRTTNESLASTSPLTMIKYKFHPCHEYEEYDERWGDKSSQASSSRSSVSSFSVNQQQMHISMGNPGKKWVNKLLPMGLKNLNIFNRSAPTFREFTNQELVQATNNYSEDRILGKGRFSTVYKGILADKTIVAVKKCRSPDEDTSKDFENEKFILSRINHVNVAKLLGWCAQVKGRILVLEYYPNGTFSELIQQGRDFNTRLRVATEAAQALVFLHYEASSPIIHRDVKSSNILLNAKHEVKVSDFGYSRILHSNDSLTWTFGDQTWTMDELLKMDVCDFGMVLLELLTRKTSVKDFYDCLRENRLLEILDPNITTHGLTQQLLAVAKLAARCMRGILVKRPTMKEVHMELIEASKTSNTTHPLVTDITDDSQDMTRDNTDDNAMEMISVGPWLSERSESSLDDIKVKTKVVIISCSSYPDGKTNSANIGEDEDDRYKDLRKSRLRRELHKSDFFHRGSYEYKYCGIKRIFVGHNRGISYLSVEYVTHGQLQMSRIFGRNDLADAFTEVIILDYPNEFLQTVTGSYFVTFYDYIMRISSLTFHSNLRKYGPFGYDCVQHFEASGGKIVGFKGKESQLNCLQAIGFSMVSI